MHFRTHNFFVFCFLCVIFVAAGRAQRPDSSAHSADSSQYKFLPPRSPFVNSVIPPDFHSFYFKPPAMLKYNTNLDTNDVDYLNFAPSVDSLPVDGVSRVPIDYYIAQQKQSQQDLLWGSYGRKYVLGDRPDEVTRLLKKYTSITLPVNIPVFATIFGKPEISIGVTGSADVHLSVRSDYTNLTSISALGSTQTAPAFSQDITVNVNAKIGDKLSFNADWNTLRTFDFENLLKLKYTGHEDDIIQNVEAGNVTLQTPSQLIAGSQALFGLKVGTQFGPFYLQALASQKKGETKRLSLSSGQTGTIIKHVYDYSQYHYFLDKVYTQFYEDYYKGTTKQQPAAAQPYAIVNCEVWVTSTDATDPTNRQGVAWDTISPIPFNGSYSSAMKSAGSNPQAGSVEVGLWHRLLPTQYTINREIGILHINEGAVQFSSGTSANAVAVAYRYVGADKLSGTPATSADDMIYGTGTLASQNTSNPKDTIILKLIRPRNLVPGYTRAWNLQLKSIYSLNTPSVKPSGVDVGIVYYNGPGDSTTLSKFQVGNSYEQWITVVGLDKTNGSGGPPDGKFDAIADLTIDTTSGLLIFPYLKPFSSQKLHQLYASQGAYDDSVAFDRAYDTLPQNAGADLTHDKFLINMRVQGATSNVINLNAFNIAPGSVQVTLNGTAMVQGVDYTVDEFAGQVTIRNQQAMQPGANVQITYEQNDVFSTATKTLLGARGDYIVNKNVKLGFTLFDYNQKIFTDKIQLGEEPISNVVGGLDGSATMSLPFISKTLGLLPMFDKRAKTTLTLRGEVAYVMPSSTGSNSNIATDGTAGTALIDDFEGARFSIPLGGSYGFWHFSSPPAVNYNNNFQAWDIGTISDSIKVFTKAKLYWYNIVPSDVLTTDVWPRRSVGQPTETTTVLNFAYDPHQRGIYNYEPNLADDPRKIWAGTTRVIYNTPTDLTSQNVTDLEIWMKVITPNALPPTAKLFFDLGLISEDIIPNGFLDTEDGINPDYPGINGILNPGEDVGIDGLTDAQEQVVHATEIAQFSPQYPDMLTDPAGDDWSYTSGSPDYTHINGLENNAQSDYGRNPDTEDLNGNNTLDASNSYFEYEINLDTTNNNQQKIGSGTNGWTEIRIPLRKYNRLIGSPSLQNVQYVRFWFAGFTDPVTVRFAQIDLVGSRWQRLLRDTTQIQDSSFAVSFVNYEDNSGPPDYYYSPPGVTRARNPYITDHIVYENEQSLELKLDTIRKGDDRQAVRYEPGIDLFNYNQLAFFVHGDETQGTIQYTDTTNYTADFYIRFGLDTVNYYEYREPLHPGWDDIRLDFSAITAIKSARDSSQMLGVFSKPAAGHPLGAKYSVRGNPTVTRVQYFSLGVACHTPNGNTSPPSMTTNVWVDELRLVGSVTKNDWAATASATLVLGELGQVQVTGTQMNPDYHSMDTRFGDRIRHQSWSFAAQSGLERVLKFYPGLSVPIVYSHTEALDDPRYLQQSDVDVNGAVTQKYNDMIAQGATPAQAQGTANNVKISSQTLKVTDAYSIASAKVPIPLKYWAVDDTWNKLTYGFDYSMTNERSPVIQFRQTWQWTARVQYGVQIKPFLFVKPITWATFVPGIKDFSNWKINFLPASFNAGLSVVRGHIDELDRDVDLQNPTIRNFVAIRTAGFNWPLTENGFLNPTFEYNVSVTSTLLPLELIDSTHERSFGDIFKMMFFHDRVLNLGEDNGLSQSVQIQMKPKVPHIFSLEKYTDIVSTYNSTYTWTNTLNQGDIGKGAGFNTRLTIGTTVKLKNLTDEWFGYTKNGVKSLTDTNSTPLEDFVKYAIKSPLLDYDAVSINFTQSNSAQNQGVVGNSGINNFWSPDQRLSQGPNRLYELGLIGAPDGDVAMRLNPSFPFVHFDVTQGRRAAFGSFTDNYKQDNTIEIRTQRTLWKGATLTLNWKSEWIYNQSNSIVTDSLGIPSVQSGVTTLAVTRSYLSLPPFLFFSAFNNTISNVVGKYQKARGIIEADPTTVNDSSTRNTLRNEALANAFEEGFEAIPFFPRAIQQLLPRMNWSFRWEGLEKLPFFEPFAQKVTLEHAYNASYTRQYQSDPDGGFQTQAQTLGINFTPLLAITMTMKEKVVGGTMSASARYNTTTNWGNQGAAGGTITKDLTTEISVTATYTRQGLPFPLFGLHLKNDIEAAFTFSSQAKSSRTFDVNNFVPAGTPLDGLTTITAEPSIRYSISQRVNARLFYRMRRTIPDATGSKVPETSTIEAGIDIHVSISGGQ